MTSYYIPLTFRKLTDDQVGQIQHRIIDKQEKVRALATEFAVSIATIYRAKRAVPEDLITFDDVGILRFRTKHGPRKRNRTRKTA